jgi:hypothetical protein
MMDADGRVHMLEQGQGDAGPRSTGFSSTELLPDGCDARKVLAALQKLEGVPLPISPRDAALLPLTPFERGYVLGVLAEYKTWNEGRPGT